MANLFVIATVFLFSGFAVSQIYFPQCTDASLDWSFNSIGQNPCQVTAYLQSTCWQGSYSIGPLPPGYHYTGPTGNGDADLCKCNTVTYSLICACDACQGSKWISWSEWVANCSNTLPPSTFPNPVPNGIYVPYWSTLDTTLENNWDLDNAYSAGDSPEIGPGQLIGGTSSSTGPTGSITPSSSSPTGSTIPPSGGSSSNTKAIVGGVVGAAATLLIAIVLLGILYLRRLRRRMNRGAREVLAKDETITSSSMPDPTLASTPRGTYEPSDPHTGVFGPEMQVTPWTPDVSSQVVSGPHQGSGTILPARPSSASPPPYGDVLAVPGQPTPTPGHSRRLRLREK